MMAAYPRHLQRRTPVSIYFSELTADHISSQNVVINSTGWRLIVLEVDSTAFQSCSPGAMALMSSQIYSQFLSLIDGIKLKDC